MYVPLSKLKQALITVCATCTYSIAVFSLMSHAAPISWSTPWSAAFRTWPKYFSMFRCFLLIELAVFSRSAFALIPFAPVIFTDFAAASWDKKDSTAKLLDKAATEHTFRQLLESEAKELTRIGNDFRIRHSETNRIEIDQSAHVDYLFYRMFSLINLLLSTR